MKTNTDKLIDIYTLITRREITAMKTYIDSVVASNPRLEKRYLEGKADALRELLEEVDKLIE